VIYLTPVLLLKNEHKKVLEAFILPVSKDSMELRIEMLKHMVSSSARNDLMIETYKKMGLETLDAANVLYFTTLTFTQKSSAQSIEVVTSACTKGVLTAIQCSELLGRYSEAGADKAALAPLRKRIEAAYLNELKALVKARQEDVANTSMILQQANLLKKMGRIKASHRVLSEMAEFAPHDYNVRVHYAQEVKQRIGSLEACEQYSMAIQLDPAKRNTFKTMMHLRTDKNAKDIRECIVQGVSNLPVKRAVSIVLTWDTPHNDVDLHIHEQGGQHVSYQKQESKNGGLLYYDITNGYGPEIYVLGSGPEGKYNLSLVYFSGSQRNVSGTLTVLRDAGSPEESRQDIPFVLPYANKKREIPIGSFTLTASDRSGDASVFKQP
jgi:hypothetical protein